jgi:uncharacterized membrane protein
MSTQQAALSQRNVRWGLIAVLVGGFATAAWFIDHTVFRYIQFDEKTYDEYWPRRGGLIPHISAGTVAILSGLVQLWLGLTGRIGALHRTLGKVYVAAVAVASCAGFYLSLTVQGDHFAYAAGLFLLATAWVTTTAMAVISIRKGDREQHREWMIRSYIVTFAFATIRVAEKVMLRGHVASPDEIATFLAFACWAVPLLVAEPLIQWRRLNRR